MSISFIAVVKVSLLLLSATMIYIGYLVKYKFRYDLVANYNKKIYNYNYPGAIGLFEIVLGTTFFVATLISLFLPFYICLGLLAVFPFVLMIGLIIIARKKNYHNLP